MFSRGVFTKSRSAKHEWSCKDFFGMPGALTGDNYAQLHESAKEREKLAFTMSVRQNVSQHKLRRVDRESVQHLPTSINETEVLVVNFRSCSQLCGGYH